MSQLTIDKTLIRDLAALLKEANLSEIEIETGGHRIRVAASIAPTVIRADPPMAAPAAAAAPVAAPRADAKHPGAVTSPMVGTAYSAAEPSAPPFVKVGDSVRAGQTLLIVEAMKTMNPIPAPRAGTVREILIGNGEPVEFGQVLMIVE